MALVTRCPECATLFKVVPDQLRISEGWVRCGHCNEVFDASVDLHQQANEALVAVPLGSSSVSSGEQNPAPKPWLEADEPDQGPEPVPLHLEFPDPPQLSQVAPEPPRDFNGDVSDDFGDGAMADAETDAGFESPEAVSAEAAMEAEFDRELLAIEEESVQRDADQQAQPESADGEFFASELQSEEAVDGTGIQNEAPGRADDGDALFATAAEATKTYEESEDSDSDAVEPSVPDMPSMGEDAVFVAPFVSTAVDNDATASNQAMAGVQAAAAASSSASALSVEDYTFLRGAQAQNSLWRKPAMRYGLMGLAGVLLLGLALQWLVVQREVVAAHWPQSRAFLVSLCEPMGCTVSALRRIDTVAIDSSSFTAVRRGAYRLNVVLKNRGPYPLAVPSIELALTDTQEQPVIRRVVQPHDLGVTTDTIDANGELVAAVELAVPDSETAARIAGYRLLAFYP
jgi:predicted Zn finger-like uncharacterized protein